jgi:hypothetical protein
VMIFPASGIVLLRRIRGQPAAAAAPADS